MARTKAKSNQMEAVRQAMGVRGMDASPTDLHDYILREMNLDISPNKISSYKSSIRKKAGLKGRRRKKRGRKPAEAAVPAALPAEPVSDGVSIKELRALKLVADRLGADRFREVVEFVCP
jgi:hypothetical protein